MNFKKVLILVLLISSTWAVDSYDSQEEDDKYDSSSSDDSDNEEENNSNQGFIYITLKYLYLIIHNLYTGYGARICDLGSIRN